MEYFRNQNSNTGNPELDLAWQIVSNTDTHLFLTGKAGTGKTTFLRHLRDELPKRMVVLAPTGIAAINAQGTTIHSFFQLGLGPQIPGMEQKGGKKYQFRKNKVRMIRSLDLIVIDEISMVRADILDAIDRVLRQYRDRNRPFGGVQMLMIGDVQQLAPVAREEEWRMLSPHYTTPYFFSSKVFAETRFVTVELKHVYRQSDPTFLDILNKIRTNTIDAASLELLNSRYIPDFNPKKEERYIRLTTHNRQADAVNSRELAALEGREWSYSAKIVDDFPEMSYPTDSQLTLKVGAQVMFIKNDASQEKAYYNGMLGEVTSLSPETVKVITHDTGDEISVGRVKWENTRYKLNEETNEIEEEVIGSFEQIPLKTAWAITVHKSQGLTFEHAIIDVQYSFAHGQTYVALSRCKSLEGMVLSSKIPPHAIINDHTVTQFSNDPRHQAPSNDILTRMKQDYLLRMARDLFSFTLLRYGFTDMVRLMREHYYAKYPKTYTLWNETSEKFKDTENVARRFEAQYRNMIGTLADFADNEQLQERFTKGAEYFISTLQPLKDMLDNTNLESGNKVVNERTKSLLQDFKDTMKVKHALLEYVRDNGLHPNDFLKAKAKIILNNDGTIAAPRLRRTSNAKKVILPHEQEGHVEMDELPY